MQNRSLIILALVHFSAVIILYIIKTNIASLITYYYFCFYSKLYLKQHLKHPLETGSAYYLI